MHYGRQNQRPRFFSIVVDGAVWLKVVSTTKIGDRVSLGSKEGDSVDFSPPHSVGGITSAVTAREAFVVAPVFVFVGAGQLN